MVYTLCKQRFRSITLFFQKVIVNIVRTLNIQTRTGIQQFPICDGVIYSAERLIKTHPHIGLQPAYKLLHITIDDKLQLFLCYTHTRFS